MHLARQDSARSIGSGPAQTWTCRLGGRFYELDVTPAVRTRLVLRVDGREVYDKAELDDRRRISLDGGRYVVVRVSMRGAVKRATVYDNGRDLDFDAPAGTRASRTQAWGRAHPTLFALRHVVITVGGIILGLLGLGALFKGIIEPVIRWIAERVPHIDLPQIPWPQIDLPSLPWPDIRLPRIPWPDVEPPWWLIAFFEWIEPYEDYVQPIIAALVVAAFEVRRQRRQRALRLRAEAQSAVDPDLVAERRHLAAALRSLERKRVADEAPAQARTGPDLTQGAPAGLRGLTERPLGKVTTLLRWPPSE